VPAPGGCLVVVLPVPVGGGCGSGWMLGGVGSDTLLGFEASPLGGWVSFIGWPCVAARVCGGGGWLGCLRIA
jgi:hypothetical protein